MDPLAGGIWALALSVVSASILWFFKTPKEVAGETSKRIDELEDAHHELDKSVSALVVEVKHLAQNIGYLTATIKQMDQARTSGRHPRNQ